MASPIVNRTVNRPQPTCGGRRWQPVGIGGSEFLDRIAADVTRAKRIKALSERHIYSVGECRDWTHPEHRELGLIGERSTPDRLVVYGEVRREYFEVILHRQATQWAMEAPANAPEDFAEWVSGS